jgi:hypothetical protein
VQIDPGIMLVHGDGGCQGQREGPERVSRAAAFERGRRAFEPVAAGKRESPPASGD